MDQGAEKGPTLHMVFRKDVASLNVPDEGITLNGWSLMPFTHPEVSAYTA